MRRSPSPSLTLPEAADERYAERDHLADAHFGASFSRALTDMRQLDRTRRAILVGLALLASLVTLATVVYALMPAPAASQAASAAVAPAASGVPISTAQVAPSLSGQFMLSGTRGATKWLTLHQFGGAVTGVLATVTCAGAVAHTDRAIVTGALLADGQLKLTLTQPSQPHSQTTIYLLALTVNGFSLVWHDSRGKPQTDYWQQATAAQISAASRCPA